jgi:RNA polymerase sigma-70 factor (ECF subfamily)
MAASSPTDLDLVRGLRERDREVLAHVYDDHHAAVYNLCARILGDREEAKDVTQDVFLTAFGKPPAATADVRLRPWLCRVATNACLNLIRGRRRCEPVEDETLAAAGDPFEQARTAALVETSLAALNERYRAALVLKDLLGLETGELAEVLEVSRPTADVLVHRARASFRRAYTAVSGGHPAPANLALALPALPVPAALQAPPLPALPTHAPAVPPSFDPSATVHGMPAPAGPLIAAPGGGTVAAPSAGLLAKIAAGITTKAAVVAAGAAVAAGGGAAAVMLSVGGGPRITASPAAAPAAVHHDSAGDHDAGGWTDDRREHHRLVAARAAAHQATETAHHVEEPRATHDSGSTHAKGGGGNTHAPAEDDPSSHESTTAPPEEGTQPADPHGGGETQGHGAGAEH